MNDEQDQVHGGGCLCGAVRFAVRGPMRAVSNCWCEQCRRFHGSGGAYTAAPWNRITMIARGGLKWFRSSDVARRGFCGECGASLFYEHAESRHRVAIAAGAMDQPTGLATVAHIYVASLPDYVALADDLPKFERDAGGAVPDVSS